MIVTLAIYPRQRKRAVGQRDGGEAPLQKESQRRRYNLTKRTGDTTCATGRKGVDAWG